MRDPITICPIDLNNDDQVRFVYDCRRHPKVAKHLFRSPPKSYKAHVEYLEANISKKIWMYIAKDGAVEVGYCIVSGFQGDEIELGFVVHPDWQGQGFGSEMVDLLVKQMQWAYPGKQIHLEVKADNIKAIKMYEKHGFKARSIRMDFK